jgi:prolyl oligopeptidase
MDERDDESSPDLPGVRRPDPRVASRGAAISPPPYSAPALGAGHAEPAVHTLRRARARRLAYPPARRLDQVDLLHGVPVADPYRWLEDLDSPETRAWVEAENRLTFAYLDGIAARPRIRRRLTELWNYEKYGLPTLEGGRYFFAKNDGLQNQSAIYTLDRLDGCPQLLIDPNGLSADGTIALTSYSVSGDGKTIAYGLSSGGSDWEEWRVRDVETGEDLPDRLSWVKFSTISWTHDGRGFFYSRYDEPEEGERLEQANYFQKLYYHTLGEPQSADRLVYERPDRKEWGFQGTVTDDGRYLLIHVWRGTEVENGIFYQDLADPGAPVVALLDRFDASYDFVGNEGTLFWFQTDLGAPRGRVIAIDLADPARERWREVLPETAETLESADRLSGRLVAIYLQDAHSRVRIFDLGGRPQREVELPGLGTVIGFSGRQSDRETFFLFTGFTTPGTVYHYDVESGESRVFRRPQMTFDPARYETRQVFYQSPDGTRVPMFVTARRDLALDGDNPTILYGYGGFDVSLTPTFSVPYLVWMEMGGVYAVANLRGGGEYGVDWHQAGTKLRKQNVFDDYFAAAEWLIASGYTSRERLAASGRSNGGLLVGAALTQRPDLFGATVIGVGVLDMLRFHRFTIGWGWVSDYGSPDDPREFAALYAYSPYHNLRAGAAYPPTLIATADHDDRVVPAHSFKFAAALQAAQGGPAPVLIRIETRAGHGIGKPTSKQIDAATDELAFLVDALGLGAVR